ncbi:MAG TPA: PKD domain-containing protein, partial [Planctomycetes bacterium]|nr:PKD domain-containing protein [Planctomycetota bacterium]
MGLRVLKRVVVLAAALGCVGCGDGGGSGGQSAPPAPLKAVISAAPVEGDAPLSVTAGASQSTGAIVSYEWDSDYDGITFDVDAVGASAVFNYAVFGQYVLALRVTDASSVSDIDSITIAVNTPGNVMPSADITATPSSGAAPLAVVLDASGSFDSDGVITTYLWDFEYSGTFKEDACTLAPAAAITHTYYFPGTFTAAVKVLDDAGGWDTAFVTVSVTDSIITFVDPNLEAAVREAIGKGSGDIYASDVAGLTALNA